jgi:ketosteroid isomerase-like protein
MSQGNVEVLRKAYDSAESGGVAGLLAFATEDLVWVSDPRMPDGGTHRGKENVRRWLLAAWIYDELSIDIQRIIDLDDRALGITRFHALAHDGPRVDWLWCHLVSFSGGLISEAQSFLDLGSALEAAGVSAEAVSQDNEEELRALSEAAFSALNTGDLETFLGLVSQDVEFTSMVAEAEGTVYRGHEGVRAWWNTVRGAFQDVRWDLLDLQGSGERGVAHFRMSGTLAGAPLQQTMWQAATFREGKATWWAFFRTEQEALEAVGLSD